MAYKSPFYSLITLDCKEGEDRRTTAIVAVMGQTPFVTGMQLITIHYISIR